MELFLRHTGKVKVNRIDEFLDVTIYQNQEKNINYMHVYFYNKENTIGSSTLLPSYFKKLELTLSNGGKILLVECKRDKHLSEVSFGREVYKYTVDYLVDGASSKVDKFFLAYYKVSGIMKWMQKSNFISGKKNHYIDFSDDNTLSIFETEDYKIDYYVGHSMPIDFMNESITLIQRPTIIIESKVAQNIQWFDKRFNDFKSIIELATHKEINYQGLEMQELISEDFSELTSSLLNVDSSFSTKNNLEEKYKNNYLFSCQELIDFGNLNEWYEKRKKLEPVLDLYLEAHYTDTSKIENHFLNICQALETYHARMVTDSKSNYIQMSKKKLENNQSEWFDFLVRNLKKSHVLLSERLSDLMFIDYPRYIFSGSFEFLNFPQIISDTRNYYTHYNLKKESKALKGEELIEAIQLLRGILEHHLLKELGFNDEKIFNNLHNYFVQVRNNTEYKKIIRDMDNKNFGTKRE